MLLWLVVCGVALLWNSNAAQPAPRVAVLDSLSSDAWSAGLADFIEAGLQREGVATYDRRFLRLLLNERQLSRSGGLDLKSVRQAQLPAVDLLVRGEVHRTGTNSFGLTLEAVRAADAVLAVSLHAEGKYPQDWLPTLERLLGEMSGQLRQNPPSGGQASRARAITWMPEASLWFFRGLDCYAQADFPQAVAAFANARRWDRHFRLAWLWEARSYQRLGLPAQARRVLEAAHLSDKPLGQAGQRPVFAVVAGQGVTETEKQALARQLAESGKVSVLDPRWIGASAREADLQLSGEMAARTEAGNAWLVVEHLVFLERTGAAPGAEVFRARRQEALTGRVSFRAEAPATTNGLARLARQLCERNESASTEDGGVRDLSAAGNTPRVLPLNPAEAELARCLARVTRSPADVRALLAAADACLAWQADALYHNGQLERGVEWRVREEFLAQAVEAVRRAPGQTNAPFWLASALWRQRYTPEYGIWARAVPTIPLREQMKPLLELFPQSAEATNLAEIISENVNRNRRSLPADARYLQPPFAPEKTAPPAAPPPEDPKAKGEARLAAFRSLVARKQLARASLLFTELPSAEHFYDAVFQAELQSFMRLMSEDQQSHDAFMGQLGSVTEPNQLTRVLAGWKPSFGAESRQGEVLALYDQLSKLSGPPAAQRFLEEQFRQYLSDYGTLALPWAVGLPNPLLTRLREQSARLAGSGKVTEADHIDELVYRTPQVPQEVRLAAAYEMARRAYESANYFRATEWLRELLAEVDVADVTLALGPMSSLTSTREAAFALLKHVRLFGDGELDLCGACGQPQAVPEANPAALEALGKLFQQRVSLALILGPPNAEQLAHNRQEMNRLERVMLSQYRDTLPAFLAKTIRQSGPGPETMGLCAKLGARALPLLPEIVAAVRQYNNTSTQNNALVALANIGQPAACALPVVLMALETDDTIMVQPAARTACERLGVAPRRVVPYLARLLYHPNPAVASSAAEAVFAAAALPPALRQGTDEEEFLQRLQRWWENQGSWEAWEPDLQKEVQPRGEP